MPSITDQLRQALADLFRVSASRDGAQISAALRRIEELRGQLDADAFPRLCHFLDQRSYHKAYTHLAGETPPRGACGSASS